MRLTPDGARYLRMVAGEREPLPFHLRWLLPRILGSSLLAWWLCTVISTVAVLAATWLLADQHGLDPRHRWLAVALVAGLPAVRFAWRAPVLIDMPARRARPGSARSGRSRQSTRWH